MKLTNPSLMCVTAIVGALAFSAPADAATVRFNATGYTGISGYVDFDDTSFNGTNFQFLSNTAIVGLALNVFGSIFDLGDVTTTAFTIFDTTGSDPRIVNGGGELANNGVNSISFFPDGFGASGSDGDASLEFGTVFNQGEYFAVKWSPSAVSAVPLPASLPLLAGAFGALAALRRKRANKAA